MAHLKKHSYRDILCQREVTCVREKERDKKKEDEGVRGREWIMKIPGVLLLLRERVNLDKNHSR